MKYATRACAVLASVAASTAVLAQEPARLATPEEIAEMPYIKAFAYMTAINEYCFQDKPLKPTDVGWAAGMQAKLDPASKDDPIAAVTAAITRATAQVSGDYAACAPAIAFVGRVEAKLKAGGAEELRGFITAKADNQVANEEKKKADEARADRLRACRMAENDAAVANVVVIHDIRPRVAACVDILGPDALTKVDARIERLNVEKLEADKQAEQLRLDSCRITTENAKAALAQKGYDKPWDSFKVMLQNCNADDVVKQIEARMKAPKKSK